MPKTAKHHRDIALVTSSRADYGHCLPILHALTEHHHVTTRLLVTGAHLSERFGMTAHEIERDGWTISDRIPCLDEADTGAAMARTIGTATSGFARALDDHPPDLLVLIADRYEMLAPACAATAMTIPMAHVEGGDVSEGAIDQVIRNALTMMSHVHFAPTAAAAARLRSMGEEPWRVHHAGTPSLDVLAALTGDEINRHLAAHDLPKDGIPIIAAVHAVTLADDPIRDARALFSALEDVDAPAVICFPNVDAGAHTIMNLARDLCTRRDDHQIRTNLPPEAYWSLLSRAHVLVGNTSSGIMEAPALQLPSVNIGIRQHGREQAQSVVQCEPDSSAIRAALDQARTESFRATLHDMVHPYGDGAAGPRIADVLATVPLDTQLRMKPAASI
ncbi:MAG: UDP-N-acetylglucosamine 2-epimerase [Planctomycetota bacterium]